MSFQNSFTTASRLVDVVLFAYEPAKKMVPDTSSALKAMLPICNRPMIWYCLQPLVKAGFTNFFICVNKNYEVISDYICNEFSHDIQFHFVVVTKKTSNSGSGMMSDESVNGDVTMCEAVRCFLEYKAQLTNRHTDASTHSSSMTSLADLLELRRGNDVRPSLSAINSYLHFLAEPRDALLLNCDTVLCNVDLENFVKNFYLSLSSVTMILMRPIDACNSQQTKLEKLEKQMKKQTGGQKGGGSGIQAGGSSGSKTGVSKVGSSEPREFQYQYSCVIYEEEEDYYKGLNQSSCSAPCTVINGLGFSQPSSRSPSPLGNPVHGGVGGSRQEGILSTSFSPLHSSFPSFPSHIAFTSATSPSSGGVTAIGVTNGIGSPVTVITPSSSSSPVIVPPSLPPPLTPHFHRLHLVSSPGMELDLNITHQYAAKRPNFRVERGVVNPQVYLVRNWVLRYMEECCDKSGEDADLYEDPIPFLARNQHTLVNTKQKIFLTPDQRMKYNIPTHWFFQEEQDCKCPIATLCASSQQLLPHKADPLRVSAVIYEESSHSLRRIYRIHSCHNYLSANEEIVATRAAATQAHQLAVSSSAESMRWSPSAEQETASTVAGDASMRGGQEKERNRTSFYFTEDAQQRQLQEQVQLTPFLDSLSLLENSKSGKNSVNKVAPPRRAWTLRQQALSLLLPDVAITLGNSVGKKEWHIKDSFLPSFNPLYANVTRCVIGTNVLISSDARLTDSVVMADVEIGEGVEIMHSLIGRGAVIEDNVKLVNCIVQSAYVVKKSAKDESLYEV